MIKYEDIIREITILTKRKERNEKRIRELNDQNNSILSSLKILNTKKEVFEKLDADLGSVIRKKEKKKNEDKKDSEVEMQHENYDVEKGEKIVASNVFWGQNGQKSGL